MTSRYMYYYHTNDPDAMLSYAHYSDPHFKKPEGSCIYGSEEPGLNWDYADRLWQWDKEKAAQASLQMQEQYGQKRCARRTEEFLSLYFDRPIQLVCIVAGARPDNGYPWYAYGYRFVGEAQP